MITKKNIMKCTLVIFFLFIILVTGKDFFFSNKTPITPYDFLPYEEGETIHFVSDDGTSISFTIKKVNHDNDTQTLTILEHDAITDFYLHHIEISEREMKYSLIEKLNRPPVVFPFPFAIDFPIEIRKYRSGRLGYYIVTGWDNLKMRSGNKVIALHIQSRYREYYIPLLTSRASDKWIAPGLGFIRIDEYERENWGDEGDLERSWEVRWEDVATPERLERYHKVVDNLPFWQQLGPVRKPIPIKKSKKK